MRGIVEDVLREGGVLTTDEIYCGVKAKHGQLGQLLPPRWQEKVRQILEAHCISHDGNSWFLENIEQLEERPECEASLFDPHGTSERIINDSNRGQKRTDWANTYRYLDLALHVAGDRVRNVVLSTFLSGLCRLRRLVNWVYPRGHGPVWRLWQLGQAGRDEAGRQGHSPERAEMPLRSPASVTRASSKMPGESALGFDEGIMMAPSTEAPRPAVEAVANRPLGLTGDFDRLSEQELPDPIKQKLEKLGLLLSDQPKNGALKLGGQTPRLPKPKPKP